MGQLHQEGFSVHWPSLGGERRGEEGRMRGGRGEGRGGEGREGRGNSVEFALYLGLATPDFELIALIALISRLLPP